jgi:hypothetical protein
MREFELSVQLQTKFELITKEREQQVKASWEGEKKSI